MAERCVGGRAHLVGAPALGSKILREGTLPTGPKSERRAAIRTHFLSAGGNGISFTTSELERAGLGSRRTLLKLLPELVDEGWLEKNEGHGHTETTWTMVAPLLGQTI